MSKGTTFAYKYGDNLYVNLTNRCSSACVFCPRNYGDAVGIETYQALLDFAKECAAAYSPTRIFHWT